MSGRRLEAAMELTMGGPPGGTLADRVALSFRRSWNAWQNDAILLEATRSPNPLANGVATVRGF